MDQSAQGNPYLEQLREKGYLTPEERFSNHGKWWDGRLDWDRDCPHCHVETQICFRPLPLSVTHEKVGDLTTKESDFIQTFFEHHCGQPVQALVQCLNCGTLLFIQLSFMEHSGGLYIAQWCVAPSHLDQPIRLALGNEFFNQISIAPAERVCGYRL
jgi:hypothetical protein